MNYAELQKRRDDGDLTLEECHRLGATHKAYEWACTPDGHFTEDQKEAYRKGFHGEDLK